MALLRQDGFNYEFNSSACEACGGKCCCGESGYIFVSIEEMKAQAKFLGMDFDKFCLQYIKKVGYKFSLLEKAASKKDLGLVCVFFDEKTKRCLIYEVRPKQCISFPFWDSFKQDTSYLEKTCAGFINMRKK
ncbi:zinc/iron-chelating domain-containing protein [Helicobacter sp. 13S00401-1]|uniref:YkgJ family cysteine cluster protein n=1 Tax=Helicobacter sp. 13S00401-1 TaxID=1905758 RepID=UPI000BA75226|nr:YkgJ family cysteine cluster protein [Helicobacter sp. 13S00401-1]PAF48996.1 zinc/iron-chelating domain-containing protein [Helicobacter sp. 13S00401-1]